MQRPALLLIGNLACRRRLRPRLARAFTLIEVLVAMTVTLILMGIVVTIFGAIGDNVSKSNSSMEMNDQLRSVKQRLQLDLSGVTVQMLPPRRDENGEGYFEIIEGPVGRLPPNTRQVISETLPSSPAGTPGPMGPDTTVGDNDDILMLTTRSKGEMFLGRGVGYNPSTSTYNVTSLQSQIAEVAWFMRGTTLYRRQLLVRPDLPTTPTLTSLYVVPQPVNASPPYFTAAQFGSSGFSTNFYSVCDLSARMSGGAFDLSPSPPPLRIVANSLEDLTKRENRFAHRPLVANTSPYGWPHDVRGWGQYYSTTPFGFNSLSGSVVTSGRLGLPTLRECSALNFPLPGTIDLISSGLVMLGDQNGNGMTSTTPWPEMFDAWSTGTATVAGSTFSYGPNPPWYAKVLSTGAVGAADPLTGSLTGTPFAAGLFPDNSAPSPFGSRYGEDVIMTHVLSFDVRAWDPQAVLISYYDAGSQTTSLFAPGDPGYLQTAANWLLALASSPTTTPYAIAGRGAYVDLYYSGCLIDFFNRNPSILNPSTFNGMQNQVWQALNGSTFAGPGNANSQLGAYVGIVPSATASPYLPAVYDTGSWHYENDGIDQGLMIIPNGVATAIADEGTNGLDDNGDGVVDDLGELEAPPPYFDTVQGGYPLRGVQIKIRCFDVDSQEIREVTIVQEFVPE